jgi:cell division protein FtsW (lipid II flippase)
LRGDGKRARGKPTQDPHPCGQRVPPREDTHQPVRANVGAATLTAGFALYLVGLSSLRKRNLGSWNVQQLVLAAVMFAVTSALEHVPATALVAIVAAAALVLITYERIRIAQWRKQLQDAHPTPES